MFTLKKVTVFEHYCPNEHSLLLAPLPQSDHFLRFCHTCGLPLEEGRITYDAAFCSDCNNSVHPSWNYCPYCGQGREADEEAPPAEQIEKKTPDDVTEDDVPDINAVFRVCSHFWEMEPIEICSQLGYKTLRGFIAAGVSPWSAWNTIRGLKQPQEDNQ